MIPKVGCFLLKPPSGRKNLRNWERLFSTADWRKNWSGGCPCINH